MREKSAAAMPVISFAFLTESPSQHLLQSLQAFAHHVDLVPGRFTEAPQGLGDIGMAALGGDREGA